MFKFIKGNPEKLEGRALIYAHDLGLNGKSRPRWVSATNRIFIKAIQILSPDCPYTTSHSDSASGEYPGLQK